MSEIEVRIVELAPMRVASAHSFGKEPEVIAWEKILTWMKSRGLNRDDVRMFGFNNPDPAPGSPNYGYEQWVTVGPDVTSEGEITVKAFGGGHYAVTRCTLPHIGEAWKQLAAWRENSHYQCGHTQWLEEMISPPGTPFEEAVLDIYLPIAP